MLQDDCGDWVTALCPYGDVGCPDSEGDYDVDMPEPMAGKSGSGYKIRVMDVNDESESDCSDEFELIESEEAEEEIGDTAYLVVTSPEEGDLAMAGGEYTVEVRLVSVGVPKQNPVLFLMFFASFFVV